jgi:hypothetical protein
VSFRVLPGASAEPAVKVFRDGGSARLLISREKNEDGQAAEGRKQACAERILEETTWTENAKG